MDQIMVCIWPASHRASSWGLQIRLSRATFKCQLYALNLHLWWNWSINFRFPTLSYVSERRLSSRELLRHTQPMVIDQSQCLISACRFWWLCNQKGVRFCWILIHAHQSAWLILYFPSYYSLHSSHLCWAILVQKLKIMHNFISNCSDIPTHKVKTWSSVFKFI